MKEGKKATLVGTTCIAAYVVNYYLRHILSVLTPTLLTTGLFTVEHIAALSSTYMLLYAAGQLVNGFLGDIFSPKKMVSAGLFVSGGSMILFPFIPTEILQIVVFAMFGFGLSMMRGPLMKIISENTNPNHARIICVFFSFASFAGPLIASLFAMINGWNYVFIAAGGIAVFLGFVAYIIISAMEKKGLVSYIKTEVKGISSILAVFKIEKIVFYIVVACLVEIGAASISQWITTFLTSALGFEKETANFLYTGISTVRSFMPFVALAIFRLTKEKDVPMMRVTFTFAAVMFACLLISPDKWASLVILALALMSMSCTSALLWSIYIPSLGKTGKVSSVNGVIDCIGYIAAAGANLLFANVMANVGWDRVYILWSSIGIIGLVATFFVKTKKAE
ncbi:MAG: MFS transporter [Clostridia bacterium]|nr:MFS transporter [Clostridia bacterium]